MLESLPWKALSYAGITGFHGKIITELKKARRANKDSEYIKLLEDINRNLHSLRKYW